MFVWRGCLFGAGAPRPRSTRPTFLADSSHLKACHHTPLHHIFFVTNELSVVS